MKGINVMVNEMGLTEEELGKEYSKQELYGLSREKTCIIVQGKGRRDRYKITATYKNADICFCNVAHNFYKSGLCTKDDKKMAICTNNPKTDVLSIDNVLIVKELDKTL